MLRCTLCLTVIKVAHTAIKLKARLNRSSIPVAILGEIIRWGGSSIWSTRINSAPSGTVPTKGQYWTYRKLLNPLIHDLAIEKLTPRHIFQSYHEIGPQKYRGQPRHSNTLSYHPLANNCTWLVFLRFKCNCNSCNDGAAAPHSLHIKYFLNIIHFFIHFVITIKFI